ncbi:MAG: non-hydrolyzing UDP-N-acetylglucosamine 2-epimerase [Acidimicrobiia bacterium]
MPRPFVVAFAGTTPEVIRLVPVVLAARADPLSPIDVRLVVSGEQPDAADAARDLGVTPDAALRPSVTGDTTTMRVSTLVTAAGTWLEAGRPAAALVQGESSTAVGAALAAGYARIPVAQLDTGRPARDRPRREPEETHRRALAALSDLHLAPTPTAADELVREGHGRDSIVVTGSTAIDALHLAVALRAPYPSADLDVIDAGSCPVILVAARGRASWGEPDCRIAAAVTRIAVAYPDVSIAYCLHPNPVAAAAMRDALDAVGNLVCVSPMPYGPFARLLARADLVLTDSDGIQETVPSLGIPVLVLRDETDRMESVRSGVARLVGTDPNRIFSAATGALRERLSGTGPARPNPYGDGYAAARVVGALTWLLGLSTRPNEFVPPMLTRRGSLRRGSHRASLGSSRFRTR